MGQRWLDATQVFSAHIAAGSTSYSVSIGAFNTVGAYAAMYVSMGAVTGGLTVAQQCSIDNTNWYGPTNATAVSSGAVYAAVSTATERYVTFTPALAPYSRFSISPIAAATVSLTIIAQGERM